MMDALHPSPRTMVSEFVHGKPSAEFLPNSSALFLSMILKLVRGFVFVTKESLLVKF